MILQNQSDAIDRLQKLSDSDTHTILLHGQAGVGKTFLAKEFSVLKKIHDFVVVEPKMQAVRDIIDTTMESQTDIVLCIENLDLGVQAVSYALLKFIEEPLKNLYIVVTCRNIKNIPATIVSRSATIYIEPMCEQDLLSYANTKNPERTKQIQSKPALWKSILSISDIDYVLDMSDTDIAYMESLNNVIRSTESISFMSWKLQRFPDDKPTNLSIIIRYLIHSCNRTDIRLLFHKCLIELSESTISKNAVLSKYLLDMKYAMP